MLAWATLPEESLVRERKGVILVGIARCIGEFFCIPPSIIRLAHIGMPRLAMVLVRSKLTKDVYCDQVAHIKTNGPGMDCGGSR